jgi:iron(III) transport system permease protein
MIIVGALGATAAEYLLLLGPFRALSPAMEEASLVCGGSRLRTFFQIEIPVLGPSILGVVILGFVLGMGLLTGPLLLGEPAGIYVLPTEIYRLIDGVTPADYAGASTLSLLLVLVVLALVGIQSKVLGRRQFVTVTGKSAHREPIDIGPWKWLGTLVVVIFTVFALVLPLGQFVLGSFESYFGVYSHFTTGNYSTVFHQPGTRQAFTTTIMVAVVSGFVATLLAVLITLVSQRSQSRLRRLPDICVWLLWAVPGITLSLGLIWAYLSVPGLKSLYGTQWIVLLALIVGTTPIAARAVGGSIGQIGRELEEAARTSGASALRATAGILVRLIVPSFVVSWLLSGIVASGNLDIPILLASSSNQTVPLLAYDLYDNGSLSQAAATFCVFIGIVAALLVVAAAARLVLGFRRRTQRAALAAA